MKNRRILIWILVLCLTAGLLSAPQAAFGAGRTVSYSLKTLDGKTVTEKTYGSRLTLVVCYRSRMADGEAYCPNSANLLQGIDEFARQDWIKDNDVRILMVSSDGESEKELRQFIDKYAPERKAKNVVYTKTDEDLQWKLCEDISLTYCLAALVRGGEILKVKDAVYDTRELKDLFDGVIDLSYMYQDVTIDAQYNYADAFAELKILNAERKAEGRSELVMDKDLLDAAMQRAAELSIYYSPYHLRPSGDECFTVSPKMFSENIAAMQQTPEEVMDDWMHSPGHYTNIMRDTNVSVGLGAVTVNGNRYWAQVFGGEAPDTAKASSYPDQTVETPSVRVAVRYLETGEIRTIVTPELPAMTTGQSEQLEVYLSQDGEIGEYKIHARLRPDSLSYTSSNPAAISVSADGTITSKREGSAAVTIRSKDSSQKSPALAQLTVIQGLPFTDVRSDTGYYKPVKWAYENGIVSGTSATTFGPGAGCTRGQFAMMLYRYMGKPDVSGVKNPFADVASSKGYYRAVLWAYSRKIVSGTSPTTFAPGKTLTRAQIVMMLYRMAGKPDVSGLEMKFADVKKGKGYYDAVLWANSTGIVSGTSQTTFSPNAKCTRAQLVMMLSRYNNRVGKK